SRAPDATRTPARRTSSTHTGRRRSAAAGSPLARGAVQGGTWAYEYYNEKYRFRGAYAQPFIPLRGTPLSSRARTSGHPPENPVTDSTGEYALADLAVQLGAAQVAGWSSAEQSLAATAAAALAGGNSAKSDGWDDRAGQADNAGRDDGAEHGDGNDGSGWDKG